MSDAFWYSVIINLIGIGLSLWMDLPFVAVFFGIMLGIDLRLALEKFTRS